MAKGAKATLAGGYGMAPKEMKSMAKGMPKGKPVGMKGGMMMKGAMMKGGGKKSAKGY